MPRADGRDTGPVAGPRSPVTRTPRAGGQVFGCCDVASWARLRERRTGAVVGHAWIRRSALRRRRVAWALWALLGVAAVADVLVRGPADQRVVTDFGGELFALLAIALVLIAYRVKAVVDPDDGTVGVRG